MLHKRNMRKNIRVCARDALAPPLCPSLTNQPPNASLLSASHAQAPPPLPFESLLVSSLLLLVMCRK
jgi:hypothetical protein